MLLNLTTRSGHDFWSICLLNKTASICSAHSHDRLVSTLVHNTDGAASECPTKAPTAVDKSNGTTMTALTANVAIEGEKDEIYYWDPVKFLVSSLPADRTIRKALTRSVP